MKEQECTKRIDAAPKITKDLYSEFDGERCFAERLAELEAVVALRWLREVRESARRRPVEFSGIDDNTRDGVTYCSDTKGRDVSADV